MPKKGKKKRPQAVPVGMGPSSQQDTSAGATSQQTPSATARQQTVSPEPRPSVAPASARQQTVSPEPRPSVAPASARQQVVSPEPKPQTFGAIGPVVPFTSTPSPPSHALQQLTLEDPQLEDPSAKGRSKPTFREISPERIGIQYQKYTEPLLKKPGFNKEGRPIKLISNCFPLKIPSGDVYHYDVEIYNIAKQSTTTVQKKIAPGEKKFKCLNTKCNRRVFSRMVEHADFKNILPVYDGRKNMYTRKRLKFTPDQLKRKVVLPSANPTATTRDEFWVYIKPVQKQDINDNAISLDPLHALFAGKCSSVPREVFMAIETVLKHSPALRHIPLGQSFFYPPRYAHPLGNNKEIWFGYHQSMRLGQMMPMVNLDVSASTFFEKGPLLNYVAVRFERDIAGLHTVTVFDQQAMKSLNDMLKNVQIEVTHLPGYRRKYRILRFTQQSAARLEFEMDSREGGGRVMKTVAQYFQERYRLKLEFPNLPCVQIQPEAKNSFFPIEVCDVVEGQRFTGTLLSTETAQMVKDTAYPPKDRFQEIKYLFQEKAKYALDPYLKEFGFSVGSEPIRVEGRQLQTPTITYHTTSNDPIVKPRNGSWNMMNKKFVVGAQVRSWVLVSFSDLHRSALEKFAGDMVKLAGSHGMWLERCKNIFADRPPRTIEQYDSYLENILRTQKRNHQIELIVFVNSQDRRLRTGEDPSKALYRSMKDTASRMDIVSQCVKPDNVRKCNPGVVANILLKVNAKMGGTNSILTAGEIPNFMREPIMFVGADVTHPSPTGDIACSVAAVVGSIDHRFSIYVVATRAQINKAESKTSREIINDMEGMMVELLTAFQKRNGGRLPLRIVVYRDGVSDGEIAEVRDAEVDKIRNACRTVDKDKMPKLTYVVMQKRHHVRTMPEDPRDAAAAKGNPIPGTLIDSVITHPLNYDFFLYPHYGLQGTSRPAYHTVVNDDNGTKVNEMHKMTLYLSYIYARCTKGISCPAPARYADLAAFAARQRLLKHKLSQPRGPHDPSAAKLTGSELNFLNTLIKLKFEDIV